MNSRYKKAKTSKIISDDPVVVLQQAYNRLQQAEEFRAQGQYDRAEKLCVSLLRQFPDYYGALHTLGLVHGDKGNHHEAVRCLVQAAMLNSNSWTTFTALAGEYLLLGAKKMAIRTLHEALAINATEPSIFVTLAQIHTQQREYLSAYDVYSKALELEPQMQEAIAGYVYTCIHLGKYSDASSALESWFGRKTPPSLEMLKLLVSLPASFIRRDVLADLDKLNNPSGTGQADDEIDIAFIRLAALDKMQRYDEAWQTAVQANDKVRASIQKEMSNELKMVEARLDWIRKNSSQFKNFDYSDDSYPTTLLILGPSRSGKTTAESLMASQFGVKRGYENPAIEDAIQTAYQMGGLITYDSIGQLPLQLYPSLRDAYRKSIDEFLGTNSIFTTTSPGYIWDSPLLLKAIPNVRFVFIKRNVDDLMSRIYLRRYRTRNTYSYDIQYIQNYAKAYNELIELMSELLPSVSRVIVYEDMVVDPLKATDEMCELVGIEPDHTVLPQIGNDIGCGEPYKELMAATLAGDQAIKT